MQHQRNMIHDMKTEARAGACSRARGAAKPQRAPHRSRQRTRQLDIMQHQRNMMNDMRVQARTGATGKNYFRSLTHVCLSGVSAHRSLQ
jgi:hypothetical protein